MNLKAFLIILTNYLGSVLSGNIWDETWRVFFDTLWLLTINTNVYRVSDKMSQRVKFMVIHNMIVLDYTQGPRIKKFGNPLHKDIIIDII